MLIDYIYRASPRFVSWLKVERPGVVQAMERFHLKFEDFDLSARVELNDRFRARHHMLTFPFKLTQLIANESHSFDRRVDSDDAVVVLDAHPDDLYLAEYPLVPLQSVTIGTRLFLRIHEAAKLGLGFVETKIKEKCGFFLKLENTAGEIVDADMDELHIRDSLYTIHE